MSAVQKWLALLAGLILISCAAPTPVPSPEVDEPVVTEETEVFEEMDISGVVLGEDGKPISGATVRVQATNLSTTTGEEGDFILGGVRVDDTVRLTAFSPDCYIVEADVAAGQSDEVVFELHAHNAEDHPEYEWLSSGKTSGEGENSGCAECHSASADDLTQGTALPFDDWLNDAHSQSATNVRFLTMYAGTDVNGNQSPVTGTGYSSDYGSFPISPDLSQDYYGPGFKLDFPDSAGNCATCHLPAAAVNMPYGVDPADVEGVGAEGVACDFCHKVWDVKLDPSTGLPYANMPGVLSYEFRRPPEGHQFFAGPYDDVAPGEDTYSPVQRESAYCAGCHFGTFWDTTIYNSFGEWLDSPYSETGQTCQDCHMPSGDATHFALAEKGGLERDPATIFSHRMPGASDEKLLQNAVTMEVSTEREGDQLVVTVTITNNLTGHHVPTDSPLRHLILLVQATDSDGNLLHQDDGPTVPTWGGEGDPAAGYYAGLPGTAYAKILEDVWTGISPTGAYWNPTRVVSDNRIPAMGSDTTVYTFAMPEDEASVEVELLFRRAFIELADWKGWEMADILMESESLTVGGGG